MRLFARGVQTFIILLFVLGLAGGRQAMIPDAFASDMPQQAMEYCDHNQMMSSHDSGKASQNDCRCGCVCALMHVSSFTTPANAAIMTRFDVLAVSYTPGAVTSRPASAVVPPSPPPITAGI